MKWLFCIDCGSGFSLGHKLKSCDCGSAKGKYINDSQAVTNGNGVCVAVGNGSFMGAVRTLEAYNKNTNLVRNDFIDLCRVEYCWVRPHEGEGNPHTKIDKNLKEDE